jgi:TPR repeat protein
MNIIFADSILKMVPDEKRMMRNSVLLAVCCLALGNAAPALADDSISADVQALIDKAKNGDVAAQVRVATAFELGQGAPRDSALAQHWYQLAAEQGNAAAQNSIGNELREEKKYLEAMKWFRLAAEQGNAEAQNSLADELLAGKRYAEALPWYERASAQGNAMAISGLGYLYDLGLGVTQDRHKGFELYTRAAELGYARAMWNIANMYGAGQLGEADFVQACVWTFRAQQYASPSELRLKKQLAAIVPQLEQGLLPEQLASCKRQAQEWPPSIASGSRGLGAPAAQQVPEPNTPAR